MSASDTNVRVTEHEMSRIPGRKEQAIPLPDGGYFGTLNVYHNLHCVVSISAYKTFFIEADQSIETPVLLYV